MGLYLEGSLSEGFLHLIFAGAYFREGLFCGGGGGGGAYHRNFTVVLEAIYWKKLLLKVKNTTKRLDSPVWIPARPKTKLDGIDSPYKHNQYPLQIFFRVRKEGLFVNGYLQTFTVILINS